MTKHPVAVEFTGVSKSFPRTGRVLLRDHVAKRLPWRRHERFEALKNLTFRVPAGENLAVIGTNGSGKSTLLGLMAGLASPDGGSVRVCGRVAALLELGSGFHPDLTGAENVYLNASLLGLTRRRTDELLDSILDFCGLGDFIYAPLRTYSTGMAMRLAFSVAVHMDPDILLIDEVIGVGDQAFQQKCFEKISEFKYNAKTLVCVSHNAELLSHLCDRALWLDHGEIVMDDDARSVLRAYEGRTTRRIAAEAHLP